VLPAAMFVARQVRFPDSVRAHAEAVRSHREVTRRPIRWRGRGCPRRALVWGFARLIPQRSLPGRGLPVGITRNKGR